MLSINSYFSKIIQVKLEVYKNIHLFFLKFPRIILPPLCILQHPTHFTLTPAPVFLHNTDYFSRITLTPHILKHSPSRRHLIHTHQFLSHNTG